MDKIIIKIRSDVKVTVTGKWYVTLGHHKMHIHTNFELLPQRVLEICSGHNNS